MTDLLTIILAAGDGKRMRSATPKVLHPVGGMPIIGHIVRAAIGAGASDVAVITAPGHDRVRVSVSAIAPRAQFFEQAERKGTAHAASMAKPLWQDAKGYIAIVYGDHPLLRPDNFKLITDRLDAGMDAAILGFIPADPTGYGRLITDGEKLLAIREHKDASAEERKIGLCNACILGFRAELFRSLIDKVSTNNVQGEYYVTDLVGLANDAGKKVGYAVAPERDVLGVNDRMQLAKAEAQFQELRREDFMAAGVTLHDPKTVYFSYDTEIGKDVTIEPNVFFGPGSKIGDNVTIRAFSHIEGAIVGNNVAIGPFARLRPEAVIADGAHIGNFVEIKQARIGAGAKANHLSYVGDAEVGAGANIGAGTITCNYDGFTKTVTRIGEGAFIGSNTVLVAPVSVGAGAYIAAGSAIVSDVPADALSVGRGRQVDKPGRAAAIRAQKTAEKEARRKRGQG